MSAQSSFPWDRPLKPKDSKPIARNLFKERLKLIPSNVHPGKAVPVQGGAFSWAYPSSEWAPSL